MGEFLPNIGETLMTVREKQCIKCGLSKPLAQFKRKLTMAQSRAMLQRPTLRNPIETTSKLCKQCQPKPKITLKTLRNKISDGDIHPIIGEQKIRELDKAIRVGRSKVMKEYWQGKQDAIITPWYRNIQKQTLKKQRYASLQRLRPMDANLTAHSELDYQTAKKHKADLFLRIKTGEAKKLDLLPHINDYYTATEKAELMKLKQAIPKAVLMKLRGVR